MNKKFIITNSATLLITIIMIAASELLQEKEIIFPEITAIAVGILIAPRRSWQTSKPRILILITICSVTGILIVRFLPVPLLPQLILAFSAGQLIYLYSKTTFAPLMSAVALPVLIQTKSLIYPASAIILTAIILLILTLMEKLGIKEPEEYEFFPFPEKTDLSDMLLRIILMSAFSSAVLNFGFTFAVAPPILVAFTEFSKKGNSAIRKPAKIVLLVTLCAAAGAICRSLIAIHLALPLTLAALLAAIIMLIFLHAFRMYLPPAGALATLPMLIPQDQLLFYPIQIFTGILTFTLLAKFVFQRKYKTKDAGINNDI
ncbi:MAG: hypothetical protein HFE90_05345 [Firmicutes bacterium]|nr:hypothetical protein [Bacillota bacterium]